MEVEFMDAVDDLHQDYARMIRIIKPHINTMSAEMKRKLLEAATFWYCEDHNISKTILLQYLAVSISSDDLWKYFIKNGDSCPQCLQFLLHQLQT
jgi:hypothetical protein